MLGNRQKFQLKIVLYRFHLTVHARSIPNSARQLNCKAQHENEISKATWAFFVVLYLYAWEKLRVLKKTRSPEINSNTLKFFNWIRCLVFETLVFISGGTFETFYIRYAFSFTGCRPLNSRITSSNDSNCSSITITTIIRRLTTRTCTALLDRFHQLDPSHQIQWACKWHPTIRPCTNRIRSSFHQTVSIWTCISLSAVHATCSTV